MRTDGDDKAGEVMEDDVSQLVLEISSNAPTTPTTPKTTRKRWRFAEIAAVVVVGLLVVALLVNRLGPRPTVNHLVPPIDTATPPPLQSTAGAVIFTDAVSWGKLQINGRDVSVATDGRAPLYLPRGQNTLTYQAPPLPILICTISAPAAQGDTCQLASPQDKNGWQNTGGVPLPAYKGRIVDLKAVPDRLAPDQREALLTAIQRQFQSLDTGVEIQPGDHYATPEGRFVTADRSFKMTLHYDVAPETLGPDVLNCTPYCGVPYNHWSIATTIHWGFIDQYGKPETVLQGPGRMAGVSKEFYARWDGTWQVVLEDTTGSLTLCGVVFNTFLARAGDGAGGNCINTAFGKYGGILLEAHGADPAKIGHVLYRGGALIALDGAAHTLAPWMPMASAHERSIGRQLSCKC
jgi:hypothetical protein